MEEMETMVRKVCVETLVCVGLKEYRDYRAHPQDVPPTLAGVGQPAPPPRAPSSYMLVELEGHTISTQEEQPTISVCQMIQTISNTRVELVPLALLLELSISMPLCHLSLLLIISTYPVLCAMWPLEVRL